MGLGRILPIFSVAEIVLELGKTRENAGKIMKAKLRDLLECSSSEVRDWQCTKGCNEEIMFFDLVSRVGKKGLVQAAVAIYCIPPIRDPS